MKLGGRRDTCKMGHVVKKGKEVNKKPVIYKDYSRLTKH